jgi:hypothetical protein
MFRCIAREHSLRHQHLQEPSQTPLERDFAWGAPFMWFPAAQLGQQLHLGPVEADPRSKRKPAATQPKACAGYLGYPFQYMCANDELYPNLFLSIHVTGKGLHSAHYPLILERISQAACLCEAEKRMKVHFSCINHLFGRLSKEVASTAQIGLANGGDAPPRGIRLRPSRLANHVCPLW